METTEALRINYSNKRFSSLIAELYLRMSNNDGNNKGNKILFYAECSSEEKINLGGNEKVSDFLCMYICLYLFIVFIRVYGI